MKHNILNSLIWLALGGLAGLVLPVYPIFSIQAGLAFCLACISLLFTSSKAGRSFLGVCFCAGLVLCARHLALPPQMPILFCSLFAASLVLTRIFARSSGRMMLVRSLFFLSWILLALFTPRAGIEHLLFCALSVTALNLQDGSHRIFDLKFWKEWHQRKVEWQRLQARNRLIENLMTENMARLHGLSGPKSAVNPSLPPKSAASRTARM